MFVREVFNLTVWRDRPALEQRTLCREKGAGFPPMSRRSLLTLVDKPSREKDYSLSNSAAYLLIRRLSD